MILACAIAAVTLLAAMVVGQALLSFSPSLEGEERAFASASAPLIGIAVMLSAIDLASLLLPMRVGAFVLVPIVIASAVRLVRRRSFTASVGDVAAMVVVLLVAAIPLAFVGRMTVAALTNDDATFYLAAADQIFADRFLDDPPRVTQVYCLSNVELHAWLWRTGVPNLVAATSALARVPMTAALSVVTLVLSALVAPAAIGVGLAIGLSERPLVRAVVGSLVALSAAAIFVVWQHLLGQLLALSFFPLGLVALARAIARGGAHRVVLAALLLGAGMNGFADAAVVLIVAAFSLLGFADRRGVPRLFGTAGLAMLLFGPTTWRAAWAAWGTVVVRPKEEPHGLFPQRGWFTRSPLDDAAALTGVDPWPPWPAAWPSAAAWLERAATLAALALLIALVVHHRRKRGVLVCAVVSVATLALALAIIPNAYLRAKWLLLDAAMVVPLVVVAGWTLPGRWPRAALIVYGAGALGASAQLARPSMFHVVDELDHDQLLTELRRIPPGSLVVLDGFGAPADVVHDEHRAYRAAHLAGLSPVQPGLDGGFYKPWCDSPAITALPEIGWALQRDGEELLSGGDVVAHFGRFTLRRARFATDSIGSWAPTHGWLRVEREPDGTVFRWAERDAAGTLAVFSRAHCGRLTGEVRTVSSNGLYQVSSQHRPLAEGAATPVWSTLRTAIFTVNGPVPIELHTDVTPPDPEHALAVRKLAFVPEPSCVSAVARDDADAAFPVAIDKPTRFTFTPAALSSCGLVVLDVESSGSVGLEIASGNDRRFTQVPPGTSEAKSIVLDFARVHEVTVRPVLSMGESATPRVLRLRLVPAPCEDGRR